MRKLIPMLVLAAIGLNSCGGDDQSLTPAPPPPVVDPTTPEIASVELITDNPQIPSDGGIPATITVFVKDTANNFVEDVQVDFSSSSGGLTVTQPNVTVNGVATASLSTAGDPTNRTITVTATAGELSETIDVLVTGSQLTVSGPDSLVQGDTATYTIVLVDGGGTGIPGETIGVTSANGNALAAATLTTDVAGQAQVELTATQADDDILTATGLGLTATRPLSVSDDSFRFTSPAANSEVNLFPAVQVVTVEWLQDGIPQTGETISFSTTRGRFVDINGDPLVGPPDVVTDGAGRASIRVQADDAGFATISAVADGGPTTQLTLEFIATIPDNVEVQADPFTVAPGNQATITATVRDPANNRVKNARVQFILEDTSGGTLSVGTADTDSQGRAQTFYTANDVVSGNQGVRITALVGGISDSVMITVARRELFVAFGTGNEIEIPDIATYQLLFLAIVTDSEGNGVPDAGVQFDVRSTRYIKGFWVKNPEDEWIPSVTRICDDEDLNGNGILDPGEDTNSNMTIEAGNIAAVVGGNAVTDAEGKITFRIRYPKLYGTWTEVRLRGNLTVAGTEFSEDIEFVLPTAGDDTDPDELPPGLIGPGNISQSPWGTSFSCLDDD